MTPKRLLYAIEHTLQENSYEIISSFLTHSDQERYEIINVEIIGGILITGKLSYDETFDLGLYKWKFVNCTENILNILNTLFKKLNEIQIIDDIVNKLNQYLCENCIETKRIDYSLGFHKIYCLLIYIDQKTYMLEFIAKRNSEIQINNKTKQIPILDDFDDLFIHLWKTVSEGPDFLEMLYLKDIVKEHKNKSKILCQTL